MHKQKGIVKLSYSIGEWLILLLKLQGLWVFFTLKGALIFGIFPATATIIQLYQHYFSGEALPNELYGWFTKTFKKNFLPINTVSFLHLFLLLILWVDLRISSRFLQNNLIHFFLIFLFICALFISLYLLPVAIYYRLSYFNYLKQACLLMLVSIPQTIAILLGTFCVTLLATFLPILIFTGLIPLLLYPLSWFTYQAIVTVELLKKEDY